MAYRRRQGITRATTFKEENHHPPVIKTFSSSSSFSYTPSTPNASSAANSLAVQAIRASAHKTSHSASEIDFHPKSPRSKEFNAYEKAGNDSKGFWGVIARKAKAIIEDDNMSLPSKTPVSRVSPLNTLDASTASQSQQPTDQGFRRMDNPAIRRGLDKITSSLNQIGDTFEKAFEEGRTIVENKAQDIKIHIRRKGGNPMEQDQVTGFNSSSDKLLQVQKQGNQENQLKASRDVAMATAAKAKLLLRELKTIKADLAFAKERCAQLEEENKLLRENREKGAFPGDDDLIRLQLETLLAEKARLAHENSVYTRENRFLREIVEYHQLTMQDVVYFDEGAEEVTEVCPLRLPFTTIFQDVTTFSPLSPLSPCSSPAAPLTDETLPLHGIPEEVKEDESESDVPPSSKATSSAPVEEEARTDPPAPVEDEARTNPPTSSKF